MTETRPSDEATLRSARRDALAVLLSRVHRGVLTADEAQLLRQHVEAEIRESNTARAVAGGNLRHVQLVVPELELASAAIERVRETCQGVRDRNGAGGMINASQILSLLSPTWPDGNYEAPRPGTVLDEPALTENDVRDILHGRHVSRPQPREQ